MRRKLWIDPRFAERTAEALAFAQARDHPIERLRHDRIANRLPHDGESREQSYAIGKQSGERPREARDFDARQEIAEERQAQNARVPAQADIGRFQTRAHDPHARGDHKNPHPPIVPQTGAGDDHDLRRQRQGLSRLGEGFLELRDDDREEDQHRDCRDADEDGRIDERGSDAFAQILVALHGVGEPRQDGAERSARFPGADDVHIEAREYVAMLIERLRQRLSAPNFIPYRLHQARNRRRRGEPDQNLQRSVERQSRAQQGCELASERQQMIAGYFFGSEKPRASRGCRCLDCAATSARGRLDVHGHQALIAQAIDDFGFVGGFQFSGRDVAGRVDGLVAIERHQSSRVTRRTSSKVVTPASDLRMPSSYMVTMPLLIASARNSADVA